MREPRRQDLGLLRPRRRDLGLQGPPGKWAFPSRLTG